ncbi:TatD family hydrolase [Roseospirillum parvum]|uniref:TatD DNase family protein n=1 Tax=Roseospirillum parvum TaxID=83401 RepID=A0A1G7Y824_9PROT|nr:TatD family hydrolase [Roseospirillum parvum]SDG92615.1 TatD DNase family protein [Roseospirillum parvum]
MSETPFLVDSHCHLDFPDFAEELDEVVARAGRAGIGTMLTICTHVTRFQQVRALAHRFDAVWCSVGIHPHEAGREPATDAARLIELADDPKVVGFGETGLEYFYEHSPRADQQRAFRAHIQAARETGLPLIIHSRDADADMAAILREEAGQGAFPGLVHCFSSGPELAETALELGLYLSFSGIVTFPKAEALREVAKTVPPERILVETDAPYLAPVPKRGKRNEPAFTVHTATRLAEVLGMEVADLAAQTTENFFTLFGKVQRPSP